MQVLSLHMVPLLQIVLRSCGAVWLLCSNSTPCARHRLRVTKSYGELTKRKAQHEFVGRFRSVRCAAALFQSPITAQERGACSRNLKQPTTACHHSEHDCATVALGDVLCWFWFWLWFARRGAVCSTKQELAPGPGMW
jgi:hypothetical protein